MKKKASDLITYVLKQVGRPYWNGGFGQEASKELYNQNKVRLKYGPWEGDYDKAVGQKVHDCCGMVKGFCWTDAPDIPWRGGQYEINGCGDWGVAEMYNKCSQKGDIKSMPELPGLLVFTDSLGHMGVYIGNGYVVEARGHAYGVQKNKLLNRSFTKWGRLDVCIEYDTEKPVALNKVQQFQTFLNYNYDAKLVVDGRCGPATKRAAVKAIQVELNKLGEALTVDGGCGKLTQAAMSKHMQKQGCKGNLVYIIQGLLYGHGYDPKGFDGSFGPGCDAATEQYQRDNSLEVDGKVGGITLHHLTK